MSPVNVAGLLPFNSLRGDVIEEGVQLPKVLIFMDVKSNAKLKFHAKKKENFKMFSNRCLKLF